MSYKSICINLNSSLCGMHITYIIQFLQIDFTINEAFPETTYVFTFLDLYGVDSGWQRHSGL